MQHLPIKLTAKRGNWQRFMQRKHNKRFLAIAEKVYQRDQYTCKFCGFQSKKYMDVVNLDNDYSNNKGSNLFTACSLCAQCFFLDGIGQDSATGGNIIFLPEVSQADLNHFCRVLFSSMLRDAPYKGKLHTTYLSLKDRTEAIEFLFGPESYKPNIFGQALIDSNLSKKQANNEIMQKIRLLPERKPFEEQIKFWKETVFDQIPL